MKCYSCVKCCCVADIMTFFPFDKKNSVYEKMYSVAAGGMDASKHEVEFLSFRIR